MVVRRGLRGLRAAPCGWTVAGLAGLAGGGTGRGLGCVGGRLVGRLRGGASLGAGVPCLALALVGRLPGGGSQLAAYFISLFIQSFTCI